MEVDNTVLNSHGPYSFRIYGEMYHKMGSLLPWDGQQPAYAQLYIYDDQAALAACNSKNPNCYAFDFKSRHQTLWVTRVRLVLGLGQRDVCRSYANWLS